MGNSFNCNPIQYLREIKINICYQDQSVERKEEQIIINIDNENNIFEKKISQLKKYFNENDNENLDNLNKKIKNKKHLNKKKNNNDLNRLSTNKYELMLKRLLEQKNIKRNGPKRRETIKNNNNKQIEILVNEVLVDNINNIKNKVNGKVLNQENDLLIKDIKDINNQYHRASATIDKNAIISNNLKKNVYKYRNTVNVNEIINESSGYSGLCTKQTKKTNSSKKKNKLI